MKPANLNIPLIVKVFLSGLLYFAGANFGDLLTSHTSYTATLWPPSGILLAILLMAERKDWRYYIAAAVPANLIFDFINGRPLYLSAAFTTGNILEAVAGAVLISKFAGGKYDLASMKHLFVLIFSSVFSTMISATIGVASAKILAGQSLSWIDWWSGDLASIIIFTPLIISLYTQDYKRAAEKSFLRISEYVGLFILFLLISFFVFLRDIQLFPSVEFLILIPLLWAAFRFGVQTTAITNALLASFALYGAAHDLGPFSEEGFSISVKIFAFQAFIGSVLFLALVISIIIQEQRKAFELLNQSETKYRTLMETFPEAVFVNQDNSIIYLNSAAIKLLGAKDGRDYLGKTPFDIFHKDFHEKIKSRIAAMLEKNQAIEPLEEKIVTMEGTVLDVEVSATSFEFNNRKAIHVVMRDITRRKLIEKEARDKQRFIDSILEYSPVGFAVNTIDDGKGVYVSKKFEEIYGVPYGSINTVDEYFEEVYVDPEFRAKIKERIMGDIMSLDPARMDWDDIEITTRNGENKILHIFNIPLFDQNLMISTVQDITLRRRAEKALGESETHYRTLANSGPALIWTSGTNKMCDYFNQPWLDFTGRKLEEELGDGWAAGVHPDDLQECINIYVNAFDKREKFSMDYRIRHVSGEYRWIQDNGTPRYNSSGEFIGYIGNCLDITKIKLAEEELKEKNEFIETILENAPIGFTVNKINDGQALLMSKNFYQIYGVDKGEIDSVESFFEKVYRDPVFREEMKTRIINDMSSGDPARMRWEDIPITTKHGEKKYVTAINIPLVEQNLMVSTVQDTTQRKLAEIELEKHRNHLEELVESRTEELDAINKELKREIKLKEEAEHRLEEALEKEKELSDLKSRFISTTSHEFRTPLTSILTSAGLIQRYQGKWEPKKTEEHFDRIKNSVSNLTRLIDDVLTISKAEAGKLIFKPEDLNFFNLCDKLFHDAEMNAKGDYTFEFNYTAERKYFKLDKSLMELALQNLISNAVKYSRRGGKINLRVEADDQNLDFEIKDEGIGIPKEDLPRLYESFYRSKNAIDIQGTGLGLSIVKHAVDSHGGKIEVFTEEGSGTCFKVTIPVNG